MDKKTFVKIRVPATSANCGPGFDCLGLAVSLYNTFTYELLPEGNIELEVEGEGMGQMDANADNLAFASFYALWEELGQKPVGLRIRMENTIPFARGLGSSSSAIVAGLVAASFLSGENMEKEKLVDLATKIEGHPDNVAPALLGGFTISFVADGKAETLNVTPAKPFKLVALIPDMPLLTKKAREALPKEIPLADAVFSMSRASLLVASIMKGDYTRLNLGLEDRLHQPYRLPLIPGAKEALMAACEAGAYQAIISGAGSTLMAYAPVEADLEDIGQSMQSALQSYGQGSRYVILDVDTDGATIL